MNIYERYPVGREVRVRMGADWQRGRVVDIRNATVIVDVHGIPVWIHKSVVTRDLRVGKGK